MSPQPEIRTGMWLLHKPTGTLAIVVTPPSQGRPAVLAAGPGDRWQELDLRYLMRTGHWVVASQGTGSVVASQQG